VIRRWQLLLAVACAGLFATGQALAQRAQEPDRGWTYANTAPAWPQGQGPLIAFSRQQSVFIANELHAPLAMLARGDGFRTADVESIDPGEAQLLVLINPYMQNWRDFPAMDPPSAFSDAEIETVRKWVEAGGSLLILADHAPLGGGASKLAVAFGFSFLNGHVAEDRSAEAGYAHVMLEFRPGKGLAANHPITDGATGRQPIRKFQAFGGQAFIPAANATTLLAIPQGWSAYLTYDMRRELRSAPKIDASGMAQGAAMEYGKGRIAVFGEAGGFSAQLIRGEEPVGFNTALGSENPEFVLAVLRWLVGFQPER
jgi:hypothetical protein